MNSYVRGTVFAPPGALDSTGYVGVDFLHNQKGQLFFSRVYVDHAGGSTSANPTAVALNVMFDGLPLPLTLSSRFSMGQASVGFPLYVATRVVAMRGAVPCADWRFLCLVILSALCRFIFFHARL